MMKQHSSTNTTRRCCCHCHHCHCRQSITNINFNNNQSNNNKKEKRKIEHNFFTNKKNNQTKYLRTIARCLHNTSSSCSSCSSHTYSWLLILFLVVVCIVNVSPQHSTTGTTGNNMGLNNRKNNNNNNASEKRLLTNENAASKITTITTTTNTNTNVANMFPIMLELSTQTTIKTKKKNKELLQQNNTNNNTLFVSTTNATHVPNNIRQQQKQQGIVENPYNTAISSRYMNVVPEHWSRAQSYNSLMHRWDSHVWPTPVTAIDRHLDRPPSARYIRDVNQKQIDRCRMFVEGDPAKNEFYSPDFPNNYPKNINCTKVIEAPQGQIIRLDFRNSFHIENMEDCKFDFLEIRDGAYGFSNPLGKYCGSNFPPEITSKERYLWLHFHSDESIEYSGFTAVYEFIDRSREAPSTDLNCTILKNKNEDWINSTDVPEDKMEVIIKNKIPLDCMWRIQVADNWKIQLKFFNYKLARPNHCKINFLDIFPEETVMPLRVKNFCGSAGESITSESNILHIRYYAEPIAINDTMFSILYTAFRDRGSGTCAEDEYDCEDATCIAAELKCNQRDNCKFRWDEEGCENEAVAQSEHVIIIVTVFGLILGGMIVTFLVNCVRKIMRDQKIIREHIRQSKESKLNDIERNSKASSKARSRDNISVAMSPRQKHSETSLQILDDVSNRYYQETIPLSVHPQKSDFKDKSHTILREYHDMVVQTSLCSADDGSSSTTTAEVTPQMVDTTGRVGGVMACDMGCQTRDSLFAPVLLRQKSISSSIGGLPPPPRFSTFGYEVPPPPPPAVPRPGMHQFADFDDSLLNYTNAAVQQQQQQQQQPTKQCHHHHQHQQHLQQQQQQQQQQQLKLNISNQATLPHQHQHQHQHGHGHHHYHGTTPTPTPQNQTQTLKHHSHLATGPTIFQSKAVVPIGGTPSSSSTTASTPTPKPNTDTGNSNNKSKQQQKLDESKIFIDIRNSAPDVIIMTSH